MAIQSTITEKSWIQKTPSVCGGDACVRNTRIPVWTVMRALQLGTLEDELVSYFVTPLTQEDVKAARAYYLQNAAEIDDVIQQNDEV